MTTRTASHLLREKKEVGVGSWKRQVFPFLLLIFFFHFFLISFKQTEIKLLYIYFLKTFNSTGNFFGAK